MNLKGLKINFLGDSITEGFGTTDSFEKPFHQLIKKKYGLAAARNYGICGTKIACRIEQVEPDKLPYVCDIYFGARVDTMREDADAVVVFGGTNDFRWNDAPLGTVEDRVNTTFYGALKLLVESLRKRYPGKVIVLMTPTRRLQASNYEGRNLEDYANAMKDVGKLYSVPVFDLYHDLDLDPSDPVLVPDGLHPSDEGHKVIADFVAKKLMEL